VNFVEVDFDNGILYVLMRCLIASIIVTCEVGVFTFAVVVSVFCSTTG
jgi:hypothetical protein